MENGRMSKIHKAMTKLMDPHITISDSQLNSLLRYLIGDDEIEGQTRIEETFFLPWIKQAVDKWRHSSGNIQKNILLFTSNLMAHICTEEEMFIKLNFTGILDDFIGVLRCISEPPTLSHVKLSYINLISSFLKHKSGLQWIMVTNYWFDIFTLTAQSSLQDISNKSCKFIGDLLKASINENELFCCNIIQMIVSPLKELASSMSSADSEVTTHVENVSMTLSLSILYRTLEVLLEKSCIENDFKLIQLFIKKYNIKKSLNDLILTVKNLETNFELNKILTLVLYFETGKRILNHDIMYLKEHYQSTAAEICNVLIHIATSQTTTKYFELIYLSHAYFRQITINLRHPKNTIELFQYQMLLFHVWPIIKIHHTLFVSSSHRSDELREELSIKIVRLLLPETILTLRQLEISPKVFEIEDVIIAFKNIIKFSHFYERCIANSATQILIYTVKDVVSCMKDQSETFLLLYEDLFVVLLEALTFMLTRFDLTWKDNMETIYVTEIASKFLSFQLWPSKVVVKGLELLDVAILKYLSPNMALLIDNTSDTDVVDFRAIVLSKIKDKASEVRIKTIQVVQTISQKVKNKFDSHRRLVLEADFPSIILKVAIIDKEVGVKVAALRCLQEMIQVDEFWIKLLQNDNTYDQIMQLFYLQSEGEVRSEAIDFITKIYKHQQVSQTILEKFYDIMIYAVLEDQDNSVKVHSLRFWHHVIEVHLKNQGMIDGSFPEVTFSKELKKIITFDEAEIRKCLNKVLDQLSEIGCLTVFLYSLKNDSCEELTKSAVEYIGNFMELMKKYFEIPGSSDYDSDFSFSPEMEEDNLINSEMVVSPTSETFYEDILDLEQNVNMTELNLNKIDLVSGNNTRCNNNRVLHQVEFLNLVSIFDFYLEKSGQKVRGTDGIEFVINAILKM